MDLSSVGLFHQTLVGTHLADPDLGENILKDLVVVDHIIPTLENSIGPNTIRVWGVEACGSACVVLTRFWR